MKDTLYTDFINDHWEMYSYSDGNWVYIGFHKLLWDVKYYTKAKGYKLVILKN